MVLPFPIPVAGIETLGGKYELHDLVQIDANTAGVIIGIEKDVARVLTNSSTMQNADIRMCRVCVHMDQMTPAKQQL